jgi:hypothetical protein
VINKSEQTRGVRLKRHGSLVLFCCLFPFALPNAATADAGAVAKSTNLATGSSIGGLFEIEDAQFTLRASNGYHITVTGFLGGGNSVTLLAERGHSGVEYTAPGTVTEDELKATFGSRGSVDLHFEPFGQVREAINYCDSTHPTVAVKLGTFVGTINFHGERGYTAVSTSHAEGGVGNSLALPGDPGNRECKPLTSGGGITRKAEFALLEASAPRTHIQFTASAVTQVEGLESSSLATSRVYLAAGSFTKEKQMTISRSVVAGAPTVDFSYDNALDSATITPPAPFSGTARLRKNADGTSSWAGSLKAPVPGLGTVRLAGPGFHVKFSRTSGTVTF